MVVAAALAGTGAAPAVAQAPVAPAAAIAAARAAMRDTLRGATLDVSVLTVGVGPDVYERFGHNLLWIRDRRTGESLVWEWGEFDFNQPDFVKRFLFGDTRYWMAGVPLSVAMNAYYARRRDVVVQELDLSAGQRAALDAFVRANALDENKYYRYDYFLDNCSTRLRDALDIVLDGAISAALRGRATPWTYRSETLRLNQEDPWLFLGMDLALGRPADHTMDAWQAAFIPMRFRDELRDVRVRSATGALVPLVKNERVMIARTRPVDPPAIQAARWPVAVTVVTLVLALGIAWLGLLAERGSAAARASVVGVAVCTHLVWGLIAAMVWFVWLFTRHAFWAWNPHLLLWTPLSLVIAPLIAFERTRSRTRGWIQGYHLVMASAAFAVAIAVAVWRGSHLATTAALLLIWANVSWMLHLAMGLALARLPGRTSTR